MESRGERRHARANSNAAVRIGSGGLAGWRCHCLHVDHTNRRCATTDLAFVDRDGREALPKLPNRPGAGFANGLAAWSPDGHRLAVIEQQANLPTKVWLVEPNQKQPYTLLMDFPADRESAASPGRRTAAP